MKKIVILLVVTLSFSALSLGTEGDAEVSVNVEEECQVSLLDYEQPGVGDQDPKQIGEDQSDFFSGILSNTGNEDAIANITFKIFEILEDGTREQRDFSNDEEVASIEDIELNTTRDRGQNRSEEFLKEYNAIQGPGQYSGLAEIEFSCNPTKTFNESRRFDILDLEEGDEEEDDDEDGEQDVSEIDDDDIFEAINETGEIDFEFNESGDVEFDFNESGELELDTNDTLEVLNQSEDLDIDININDTDGDFDLDAALEELQEEGELDTDVEDQEDAEPQEGDSDAPGQTPEPEPEPEPEPIPLLSLSIKPLNSTYEAPRETFTEISLEIENIGEEQVEDITLEPRFNDLEFEAENGNVAELAPGEALNESVFIEPSESVNPGIYQIPVYGSNPNEDLAVEYIDVEVTEDIGDTRIGIQEAPRDLILEQNSNNTIPVMVENPGQEPLQNVNAEIDNAENCGEYSSETIDNIAPGEESAASLHFATGEDLEECEGTIILSSEDGEFAFSELNIDVREEVGIVPEEFRVPIVASLWTVLLLAYAILTKKYGVHNMTVKVPLVLLVVGEAFIIIYLSSAYYGLAPPGLLPF